MKKHWLFTTLAAFALCVICFTLFPTEAKAASVDDLSFKLNDDGQSYTVSDCSESASGALTIPSTYNGEPVTRIGYEAFGDCSSLTSVTIPDSVTSIGSYAFYNCYSLTSVTIPDSVTSIGHWAFKYCSSLTSITIPDSVTSIGHWAFYSCTSLTSVTIPDSVISIGSDAFDYCDSLTGIWVAEDNPNYSSDAHGVLFNKAKTELIRAPGGLSGSYTIPDSVTSIGSYAFSDCDRLRSVTIPDSVTSIGEGAFIVCDSLTSVTIPDSVISIGSDAFYSCDSLTSVTIGNSVTSIGSSAFCFCSSLTSITIPDSVTSIGNYAFYSCNLLSTVWYTGSEAKANAITGREVLNNCFWHYNTCETHIYDNACDDSCNQCDWVRAGAGHIYSTRCDANCNRCGYIRGVEHQYTLNENHTCSSCKYSKTPVAPTLANCTGNSITLTAHEGFEYSKDGETWQASNLFINLTRETEYTFYQRIKATENAFASEISPALTAKTLTDCIVSYNANGGTSAPANQTKKANTYLTLSNTKPTYPGHTFLGWSTTPCGEIEYKSGDRYSQNCDLVLYAKWGETHSVCNGMGKTVTQESWEEKCTTCSGYGFVDGTGFGCLRCKGTSMTVWNGMMQCTNCKDATYIYKNVDPCRSCGRKGYLTRVERTEYPCYGCNQKGYLLIANASIAAPTLLHVGNTSVELVPIDGAEYSKDGINWQRSNVFNNLNLTTTYRFYQRYAANSINLAGPSSEALSITIQQELMRTLVCKNYDNTIYLTDTYQDGDDVPFPVRNPIKPSDETYTYTFEKWEFVELESSEKCKVYIATFKSVPIDYTVIFQNYDGREISKKTDYHYGDTVIMPTNPVRNGDDTYTYTFKDWGAPVTTCNGNKVYTAVYTRTYIDYIITFKNADGSVIASKVYHWGDAVEEPQAPTREKDQHYIYTFSGWSKPVVNCIGNAEYKATYAAELIPAKITTQPKTAKVKVGATAKFTVEATGEGLKYQWQSSTNGKSWKDCTSSTAKKATFSFTSKTSHSSNYYRCKITDSAGNVVYTDVVRLYVLSVTSQPKTQKVEAGEKVKFTVTATGAGKTYQWQSSADGKTWKNCSSSSATKATFSFTSKTSHDGNYYRCRIKDSGGNTVYTDAVRLYVLGITEQPVSKTVTKGKTAKFTVEATGASKVYQWQCSTDGGKTWKNCSSSSATKATFTFTSKTTHNGNYYRCRIKDSGSNTIYTAKVKLTVKK